MPKPPFSGFPVESGFPRPDWSAINDWAGRNVKAKHAADFYRKVIAQWLEECSQCAGDGYDVYETEHVFLMTGEGRQEAIRLLRHAEKVHEGLVSLLAETVQEVADYPHAILQFSEAEHYLDYLAPYEEQDEEIVSVGVMLNTGYPHIALSPAEQFSTDMTLAHEMGHRMVFHLALPRWVDEGIAYLSELEFTRRERQLMSREHVRRHRAFWNREAIQDFWSGEAFLRGGESTELSYHLAQNLVHLIIEEFEDYPGFFLGAKSQDAGMSAAQDHLGVTLGELVSGVLGEGNWEPGPRSLSR